MRWLEHVVTSETTFERLTGCIWQLLQCLWAPNAYNSTSNSYFVWQAFDMVAFDSLLLFFLSMWIGGQTRNYVMRQNEFKKLSHTCYVSVCLAFCFCFHAHNIGAFSIFTLCVLTHRKIVVVVFVVGIFYRRYVSLFHSINKSCAHATPIFIDKFALITNWLFVFRIPWHMTILSNQITFALYRAKLKQFFLKCFYELINVYRWYTILFFWRTTFP